MKIECLVEKIKNPLMIVEKITGKNLTLPVLESILFIAKDKSLILRSTNLSLGIEVKINTKIEKEGKIAIKGNVLNSLFSTLKDNEVVFLEKNNENLIIKTKNTNVLLKSIPCDDFPTIPIIKGEEFFVSANKFIDGLKSVYYSASTSDIKQEIGSVFIYPEENQLIFVATDSFRLAEKKIKIKENLSFSGILLPIKNVLEIIKIFGEKNEDLKINLQKNQISISSQNIYLTSRVIDGIFPDYKQIIPKETNTEAVVLKQDFINALKTASVFSDKFNQINLILEPKQKIFKIKTKNTEIGENTNLILGTFLGEEVSVNFNYKYIIDSLQSISTDSLKLQLNGNNRAMIISGVGDFSFKYLIMPMNR